jgi:hypothetical protein
MAACSMTIVSVTITSVLSVAGMAIPCESGV